MMISYISAIRDEKCSLRPSENYLFAFHPHGVLSLSAICTFAANEDNFGELFPGMTTYLCTLPVWFYGKKSLLRTALWNVFLL